MPGRKEKIRFLRRIPMDPVTGRAEWGYFLSFLNPSRINAKRGDRCPTSRLEGLIRSMDAGHLPISP